MTKKTTYGLSCERARAFPIEKALAKLGHFPTRATEKEAWFLSPIRSETQASFKVSKELNRWYDHGAGMGGNIIDLICMIKKTSVKETLQWLEKGQISFSFQQQQPLEKEKKDRLRVLYAQPIQHFGLIRYLFERKITLATASKLCHEVHYMHKGRRYFAIGLKNDSDGWELRNKYYKSSISPKDISHIKNGKDKLIITEGMFDLLSLMEIHKNLQEAYDFLVLNSTAFVSKAIKLVDEYSCVELYLDSDKNGKRTTEILKEYSKNWKDKSVLYSEVKDINEWLISRAKKRIGEKAQDVSLS
ncbi:Toprim-like [Cellulophaga baltica]|uniref:Toprim-like n=1 Tax=Cellulophaga baltica TaxID=76594 RepID=A0A1G7KZK2_9FLAO|nr:Toprim-like [Cellulophaga baltica]